MLVQFLDFSVEREPALPEMQYSKSPTQLLNNY